MFKKNEITVYTPREEITYVTGNKLFKNNEGIEISVKKITAFLNTVKIFLSNGEIIVFKNVIFTYIKKNGR